MHHPTQLCEQMRARAPPSQRSQRQEVREDPGRLLDESFFWELRPKGVCAKVDGEPAQLRDPREAPEEGAARVLNAPETSRPGEQLDYLQHVPHEGVCRGNLQHALWPDRVGDGAKPCGAPECCREGGTGHAEVHGGPARTSRTSSRWLQGSARLDLLGPQKGS